jgi:hypothetical protein
MGDKQRRLEVQLEEDLYLEVKARADGVGIPLDDFVAQCIEFALEHEDAEIDNTLPGGQGGRPDQGLPGQPDNTLPGGSGGRPDQGLPGSQPGPDNTLPGAPGRPDQGLPGSQPKPDQGLPQKGVNPDLDPNLDPDLGRGPKPDQGLPGSGAKPDQGLPETGSPKKK